jgi:hypothetical protein
MGEVLYNILTEFGTPMKLFRLIKMHLNETCNKGCIRKNLSGSFPTQNGLKQRMNFIATAFKLHFRIC